MTGYDPNPWGKAQAAISRGRDRETATRKRSGAALTKFLARMTQVDARDGPLNTARAKNRQCFLTRSGYEPWQHEGRPAADGWKAAQRMFSARGFHGGTRLVVDGVAGPCTITALQRYLDYCGFGLAVDGIAGPKTKDAFWECNGVPTQDPRCV
ncbi:peptidoglycan-binding domain-containing protein [Streptomyces ziwulingensis]